MKLRHTCLTCGLMLVIQLINVCDVASAATVPVISQQPAALRLFPPYPATASFSVVATGDAPVTYQWSLNGVNLSDGDTISGAQTPILTLLSPYTSGSYLCTVSDLAGSTDSSAATLTVLPTGDYAAVILADHPIAYWRLDETNGSIAYDWAGKHDATYVNVSLNRPGMLSNLPHSDPGIGLPAVSGQAGYVIYSNAAPDFSLSSNHPFTMEVWANFTNLLSGQSLISTLSNGGSAGYAFTISGNQRMRFIAGGSVLDAPLSAPLVPGVWYHFALTFDGSSYVFYFNGFPVYTNNIFFNIPASSGQLTLGNYPPPISVSQLHGALDEVAIYDHALSRTEIGKRFPIFPSGSVARLKIGATAVQAGQSGSVPVTLVSPDVGITDLIFEINEPTSRLTNWTFTPSNSFIASATVLPGQVLELTVQPGQVLQGPALLGSLGFTALPGDSAFLAVNQSPFLILAQITTTYFGPPGRVVVIGASPLLEASTSPGQSPSLTLFGNPDTNYRLECTTNLLTGPWQEAFTTGLTNLSESFPVDTTVPQIFYRAVSQP